MHAGRQRRTRLIKIPSADPPPAARSSLLPQVPAVQPTDPKAQSDTRAKGVEERAPARYNGTEPKPLNGSHTHISCDGGQTLGWITATWRKPARSELWRIRFEDYCTAPQSDRYNEGRDHSLHQCVKRITHGMARADGRLGTWQVLLTISIVLIPLSAHGKPTARPESHPVRVCSLCVRVFVEKSAHVSESNHTSIRIWKMIDTSVHVCGMGIQLPFKIWAFGIQ